MIGTYVNSQEEGSRSERKDYFRQLLDRSGHGELVLKRLKELLDGMLPEIRKNYATLQVNQHFGGLATWKPKADDVNDVRHHPSRMPDSYDKAVAIMGQTEQPRELLEETEQQVLVSVRQTLALYREALSLQLDDLRSMTEAEATKLQAAAATGIPKESLISAWRDKLASRWKKRLDEKESFQGITIFDRTDTELVRIVSTPFDSIRVQEQKRRDELAKAKTDASGGGNRTAGATTRPNETPDNRASGKATLNALEDSGRPTPPKYPHGRSRHGWRSRRRVWNWLR